MKTMQIFEPAMCCPTGLCGVSVDPELLRISAVLNTLQQNGIEVQRWNLTGAPEEFVKNQAVAAFLKKFGPEKLPVILVDDFIVIAGRYPANEELASWLELPESMLGALRLEEQNVKCCCGEVSDNTAGCSETCCDSSREDCCSSDGNSSEAECCCSKDCC